MSVSAHNPRATAHEPHAAAGVHADVAARLRAAGLRVTPQRRAILGVFQPDLPGHPTADEVHARAGRELPELARATVYNVLGELVRVGLLRTVEGLGAMRYDANLDARHHHFRCTTCDGLFDVHPHGTERLSLAEDGFVIEASRILLEGTCPQCRPAVR